MNNIINKNYKTYKIPAYLNFGPNLVVVKV